MKKMIFHIPNLILANLHSGSQIRPLKMLDAFKRAGYQVDVVMGYGKERKKQIGDIKKKIRNGLRYDFVYSESSTMPTLLTEKNHFPKYPFLDFGFFRFCRNNNIPIGLFYRDVYWKFREYKVDSPIKRKVSHFFYKYDLKRYKRLVDIFYLPSSQMAGYIEQDLNKLPPIKELPPGTDPIPWTNNPKPCLPINILYVGGIGELYNFKKLLRAIKGLSNVKLTLCVRKEEWEKEKKDYLPLIGDNIEIIHLHGELLLPYFERSTITSIFLEPVEYRTFAMPIKLFEYLGKGKPIIATNGTATGKYIAKHNVGWSIDYDTSQLTNLLKNLIQNPVEISAKTKNITNISTDITWLSRAKQVINDLTK